MARTRGGRPRLGRERYAYGSRLEETVYATLFEQASRVQVTFGSYLERVVALAHDYTGPFLPPPDLTPLPIALTVADLQERTETITAADCSPVTPGARSSVGFMRVDRELADRINARCDQLDVDYAAYLRAVLRTAAGLDADSVRRVHVQAELDLDGRGGHQEAS